MFDEDVSIDVTTVGSGDAELAVVCNVHGDEPTGARALRRFLDDGPTLERTVTFVVANPPASACHRRYLDVDMNRVFPGDRDAEDRERRLAAQVVAATADCETLSIHTTHATPEPVAFVSRDDPRALDLAASLPVSHVVDQSPVVDGAFSSQPATVSVEAGKVEQPNAVGKATMIVRAFLAARGALSTSPPVHAPETTYYELVDQVRKPPGDDSHQLLARNFERVTAGEAYANTADGPIVADESFVPILMSRSGYPEIFGYRGREVGTSIEEAKAAWVEGVS